MVAYSRGEYGIAADEWHPLAIQGDRIAQHHLGWLYLLGHGVPQDDKEALHWFQKAAEQGDTDAQTNLGGLYLLGDRVPQNTTAALAWFHAAAAEGNVAAQIKLGIMYEDGHGVPQDPIQAYMWFALAATNGDVLAKAFQEALGREMTAVQIAEGQRLAQEWKAKTHKP